MGMRLLIAVPTTDYIHADFVKSLCDLTSELSRKKISHKVEIQSGTLVYIARNKLSNKAINEGYTHVLWIDSDMTFPPDIMETLSRTIDEYNADIVTAVCYRRSPPYTPVLFKEIYKEKKDGMPLYTFQFGVFKFPAGVNNTDALYFQPVATRKNDQCLVQR